jgi:hypothetical protein
MRGLCTQIMQMGALALGEVGLVGRGWAMGLMGARGRLAAVA